MPKAQQQQQQEKQPQQNRTPRWIQLLIGGPVVISVLMFILLWTMLPGRQSLRGVISPPTLLESHLPDLHTLVQQRRNESVVSDGELLHMDDLVRSDSFEQWAPLIMSKCMHGMDKLAAPCIKETQTTNLVEAQELLYPAFRLRLPHFSSTLMQGKWLSQGLHLDRMRVSEDKETKGGEAHNGGRKLLNEDKLFDAVSAMLKKEGRSEKLEYFRHSDFAGLTEVASFMRDRVKMMIGPHGAAFYNARFAQPRTALIEIIPDPDKFFVPCFWEQARLLGQDYSAHVGKVVSSKNDMQLADVEEVARLVRNRLTFLDESYRSSDALSHTYTWNM
ncbi:hypothetical protein BBJ29_002829 [Phytophthora kernoviae]|uniref:Glycosyltransferase 61 catalytic domain-containing protein n=1 Tax=Phytophthora kernoviae TaxID=325452 RepID=A0A3F2RS57_9STRA|nr:hypothetical protein BBJ29_002829 [Phytophthora kernoviae]RLN63208.1 hypothetical protein BBP00_00004304 [Phytophthora kernoviae]